MKPNWGILSGMRDFANGHNDARMWSNYMCVSRVDGLYVSSCRKKEDNTNISHTKMGEN